MTRKKLWWQGKEISPAEKENLLQKVADDARENELRYYGCSQSVLDSLQKNLGIGDAVLFRAACPFAGGVGGLGEVCGAVSGGLLALGSVYGRERFQEGLNAYHDPAVAESRRRAKHFLFNFRNVYGYLTCRDIRYQVRGIPPFAQLLPEDPTPEDRARVAKMYPNHDKCGEVCAKAARFAAETILSPQVVLE